MRRGWAGLEPRTLQSLGSALDLIFLQGCDEDWKRQPFGTVLIRTPTVSGGCNGDVPVDDGGSGGGAAADADADAGTPSLRRDPARRPPTPANLEAGPRRRPAAAEAVTNLKAGPPAWQHCQKEGPPPPPPPPPPRRGRPFLFSFIKFHDSLTYTSRF